MNLKKFKQMASKHKNIHIYKLAGKISLGACLNFAVHKATFPYISKFDDDDYYAPEYLTDMLHVFQKTKADVVGKRSVFSYLQNKRLLIVRFPNQENKFTRLIAGGTISFKKSIFNQVNFADITVGEDVTFLRNCLQKGLKIYSSNKFNYVYIRRNNQQHTWKTSDRYLLKTGKVVAYTNQFVPYITRG